MIRRSVMLFCGLMFLGLSAGARSEDADGWVTLFNGKDLSGWKVRHEKYTATTFVDTDGKPIPGARKAKLDQKEVIVDAQNKEIAGAKVAEKDGKKQIVDGEGKPIAGAKINKVGGRDAIVDKDGKELKGGTAKTETLPNPEGGWGVIDGNLVSGVKGHGSDIYTDLKFTDFELHVEFLATANSGVYLQGRYEIQVDNSFGAKPTLVEKNGKKVEEFSKQQCGAIYGRIAPSKNMAKPPKEWQSFDVVFRGARGEKGKVTQKARVTLVWNGEKVIDDAEIEGPTGAALDGNTTEPGPLLLQGDHGKVTFRNVKIRPMK